VHVAFGIDAAGEQLIDLGDMQRQGN